MQPINSTSISTYPTLRTNNSPRSGSPVCSTVKKELEQEIQKEIDQEIERELEQEIANRILSEGNIDNMDRNDSKKIKHNPVALKLISMLSESSENGKID